MDFLQSVKEEWQRLLNEILGQADESIEHVQENAEAEGGVLPLIYKPLGNFSKIMMSFVWTQFGQLLPDFINVMLEGLMAARNFVSQDDWNTTIKNLLSGSNLPQSVIQHFQNYYNIIEGSPGLVQMFILYQSFMQFLTIIRTAMSGQTMQVLNAWFRPNVPGSGDVMAARGLDPEVDKQIWNVLERNGYKESDIELMFRATYQRLPVEMLIEYYNRFRPGESWLGDRLFEHGFTPERIDQITKMATRLPSMQDVLLFMGREAFEEDKIAQFGLDDDMPGMLTEYAQKHGYTADDARRWWVSHWTHPEYRTVMELWHRRQIEWKDVEQWFALVEIPPFWRKALAEISHPLITRVDLRRIFNLGLMSPEEVNDYFQLSGYSELDAARMTEFYVAYKADQQKDLSRADILNGYEDGDIEKSVADSYLVHLGYSEAEADYLTTRVDLEKDRKDRDEKKGWIKRRLTLQNITPEEARNQLVSIGYSLKRSNEYVDVWKLSPPESLKIPSKTDLDRWAKADLIQEREYKRRMQQLGYRDSDITIYWQYLQKKA